MEYNIHIERLSDLANRMRQLAGLIELSKKEQELAAITIDLESPEVWQDRDKSAELGRKKSMLEEEVLGFKKLVQDVNDAKEIWQFLKEEEDAEGAESLIAEVETLAHQVDAAEFRRMFSGELDGNNCYLEIQSGSGGTEAQDWASMLLRQYLRWAERQNFAAEINEISEGEVAGIKGASLHIKGAYAYGWLRTETGVHRLVRKSPFDSGNRRHTSFASIFVSPEIDDSFEVDINPADVRVDVYRASGAGGQHVNKTESAVRLTHLPTNTVTQCQSSRSQHANKAEAMKQLRAKLYEIEMRKRNTEKQQLENNKADIGWGSQIRSYVLDSGRIKDLRTGVEVGNTQAVLDGDLNQFIEASLKQGV